MTQKTLPLFVTAFGEYQAVEIIGEGGAGRVYRAMLSDKEYAIKLLTSGSSRSKLKRFKNEILFGSANRHQNIVKIVDHGVWTDKGLQAPFYVMPYFSDTLRRQMAKLKPDRVLPFFTQILDGVEAAHLQGVWHRDLKPENILYDEKAEILLVADFGIARFTVEHLQTLVQTKPNARLANFVYAAPEQRVSGRTVDHRADIFALGLILNEMFTGEVPHGAGYRLIAQRTPDFAYLDDIVSRMIAQKPEERPASIDEIKRELIARRNDFVSRQRLDSLKQAVVPRQEVDDPVVRDPIRVIGGDWDGERLVFFLSQVPPRGWQDLIRGGGGTYYMGYPPESILFRGDRAYWDASEHIAQQMIDSFKDRVRRANDEYVRRVGVEALRKEEEERLRLQQEVMAEEQRLKTVAQLQF